ncbi:MAG: hypothetical protein JWP85_818 [Rhodoglobus sp.]|nr:hypothetical protein [Rhodoglobus sp.]
MPYGIVAVAHLTGLFTGAEWLASPTKGLLMPALLLALLVSIPARRGEVALWGGAGMLFSWAGDLLLSAPGEAGFIAGLGSFMLAHVAYLVLFLRPLRTKRMPALALAFGVWWAALVIVLAPHLGAPLIPVAVYGLVLGASSAAALGTTRVVAIGALLFLLSDTMLAFKLFWPGFAVWQQDLVIMLAYIVGQGLIAVGAVRHARRSRAAVAPPLPSPAGAGRPVS